MKSMKIEELDALQQAAFLLENNLKLKITIAELALKLTMSERNLKRAFKERYQMGIYAYLKKARIEKAKYLLLKGDSVKKVGIDVGYTTESSFIKAFRNIMHESPFVWLQKQVASANLFMLHQCTA